MWEKMMIKPNFNKSIVNLSSTLSNYLGCESDIKQLKKLKGKLEHNDYDNIIFIIFDGLGIYDINELTTENGFYKDHIFDVLSSTMPATTTNATTSMLSCKYPSEHLWLAWSLFLEEQKRVVELYLNRDFYTHEHTQPYSSKTDITAFIDRAKTDRKLFAVVPSYCKNFGDDKTINANTIEELFEKLKSVTDVEGKKFVYVYCDEPDHTMHEFGVHSKQAKTVFEKIQTSLKNFISSHKNTLIITTADHGHIDITDFIPIYKDKDLMDLLERPMCGENRFTSFKIKEGYKDTFKKLFNKKYKKFFYLVSVEKLIKKHIFGTTENEREIKNLFGDFIAIGNSTFKSLVFYDKQQLLKGNHAGGSKEEMQVPLCIFENN